MRRKRLLAFLALAAAVGATAGAPAQEKRDPFRYNRMLGRGVNLGNALEAPREGEWGMTLQAEYFQKIRQAGFDSVRIPIRWSAHAAKEPPYTIEPEFFRRIDWAVDQALSRGLVAVVNVHHYEEMYREPDAHLPRLTALWRQIASRYRDRADRLYFELLNEPNGPLTDAKWNGMVPGLLKTVRETNPHRIVIIGPSQWSNVNNVPALRLPEDDRMLIATFHYYLPFRFTHQGAEWAEGSQAWLGTKWTGSPAETEALRTDFQKAVKWAEANRRPLYLGEFGAYSKADMDSRVRWTTAVAREAEKHRMSWAYWEFGAGFGVYDREASAWREPLLKALLPGPRRAAAGP